MQLLVSIPSPPPKGTFHPMSFICLRGMQMFWSSDRKWRKCQPRCQTSGRCSCWSRYRHRHQRGRSIRCLSSACEGCRCSGRQIGSGVSPNLVARRLVDAVAGLDTVTATKGDVPSDVFHLLARDADVLVVSAADVDALGAGVLE